MVFDSIPTAASNSKDFGKKKRVNRTAKLKQSKLDVRREQWLSQVKNRGLGFKEETNVTGGMKIPDPETHGLNQRDPPMAKLEVNVVGEENEGLMSDTESPSNSPTNFTASSSRSSCGSSSSSGGGGCFSRSITDEDDNDHDDNDSDDCLDDWEAMADALAADDIQKNHEDPDQGCPVQETAPKPEPVTTRTGQVDFRTAVSFRAWRHDDASRPQSLPNLLKQNSFPLKSGVHHGVQFAPSSCPICCEDLDRTDSCFLPCPCGYRLCLFCHKKILEDNGRCPGCRKQYDQIDHKPEPIKLTRCYSVNPRH
ncbi:hypothetical protein R6Q59_034126 [Mikania micrantha]|uniref:RING-type domain-containing protein n=1 Tax=Mikania micrantha TaxID=192012 RepID=A0A5N6NIV5_9ASTR|nr:hypothetical protein E3N88_21055 [Mikania micrantha]